MEQRRNHTLLYVGASTILGICFSFFIAAMLWGGTLALGIRMLMVFFFAALFGATLYCVYTYMRHVSWERICFRIGILSGILILFAVQLIVVRALYTANGWDVYAVYKGASQLLNGELEEYWRVYFATYPNNTFLLLVMTNLFRAARLVCYENYLLVSVLFSCFMVDLAIFISCLCAKRLFGKRGIILCFLISLALIGLNPWFTVAYSDTISMPFSVLILYMYMRISDSPSRKWLWCAGMGACGVIGYMLKPQVLIPVIAVCLIELIRKRFTKQRLILLAQCATSLAASAALLFVGAQAYIAMEIRPYISKDMQNQLETPMAHYLKMGSNSNSLGGYSSSDVNETRQIIGKENKSAACFAAAKERLYNFGAVGYSKFLIKKALRLYGDGTFGYGGEGGFYLEPQRHKDSLSTAIQSTLMYDKAGYQLYRLLLQGIWLIVLLFMVLPTIFDFIGSQNRNKHMAVLRLSITGLTMFLLLFESRPRYLYHQLPLFVLLAVMGMLEVSYKERLTALFNILKKKLSFKKCATESVRTPVS